MAWREKKKQKGIKTKGNEKSSGMSASISGVLSKDEKPVTGSGLVQAPYKKKTKKR